jgi:hypothetical protein
VYQRQLSLQIHMFPSVLYLSKPVYLLKGAWVIYGFIIVLYYWQSHIGILDDSYHIIHVCYPIICRATIAS